MNKDELTYIKENYFKQPGLEVILETLDHVLSEEAAAMAEPTIVPESEIDIKLPVIKISEAWGSTGNSDRDVIESFTGKIPGTTLEAKLQALNSVLSGDMPNANVSALLSTMMVCEILSSILRDFTESAGGFIFEGFLAGLFGGESVQVTSAKDIPGMEAAGKPITDVVLGGKHYSLKLLGPSTGVKGSFKNMVNHFKTTNHIIYLDARRIEGTEGLEFGEFTITLENFLDVFFTPFAKIKKKSAVAKTPRVLSNHIEKYGEQIFRIKSTGRVGGKSVFNLDTIQDLDSETLNNVAPFVVSYSEESFAGSVKAKWLFGSGRQFNDVVAAIESRDKKAIFAALEDTPGFQKSRQFELTKNQATSISGFKHVGTLMIGEQHMKTVWLRYAKILQEIINPIYGNLQEFTNNVNAYLLGAGEVDRKRRGVQAVDDARQLQTATDQAVKTITPEETI